jgi:LAS superfamily LD-carboxypeptidase LdcB
MELKRPARLGSAWSQEETQKLLDSISKKVSTKDIAAEHERTVSAITSQLKRIAIDYHFNSKFPMEKIQTLTGLSEKQIQYAIDTHSSKSDRSVAAEPTSEEPTLTDIVNLLKDLQYKVNMLLEK